MESVLFESREITLSLKFYSKLYEYLQENPESLFEEAIRVTWFSLHDKPMSDTQMEAAAESLMYRKGLQEESQDKPKPKSKSGFATDYVKWLSKLKPEYQCLYVADFDYPRAKRLFELVDALEVDEMTKLRIEKDMNDKQVLLEAAAYGFGGGSSDDKNTSSFDMTEGGMPKDQLKQLGMM